ncbi:beta-propeller domain-containing protein [Desulfitobacterium metallireducens]|nr:beta-propeller domain-containing protein [Desulfitobacterium metallireducens]
MNKDLFEGFNDLEPDRSLILKTQIKMEEEVHQTSKRAGGNYYMRKIYMIATLSFILIAGMFISNQQQKPSSLLPTVASSNVEELPVVGDDQNLKRLLSEVESNQAGTRHSVGMVGGGLPAADSSSAIKSAVSASQNLSAESGGVAYSGTNLQVEGVDEADIVKTDGNYLYQISNDSKNGNNPQVIISKINPASDLKVVSRLEFDSQEFKPLEMYVDSKTLVVIGTSYERMDSAVGAMGGPVTEMLVYDLKDKNNPQKLREVKLDGDYVSSRKIGSAVYFVVNKYIDYYRILKEDQAPIKPKYYDSLCQESYKEVNFSEIHYFPGTIEPNYLMIAGMDLDHPDKEAKVSTYLGSGRNIYASTSSLYVAMPHYEFEQSALTQEPAVEDAISRMPANITTQIYKFGFNQGEITYQGKGEVPGQILNQFSMDEYQGYFRIATTKGEIGATSGNESTNNVYTLDQNMQESGKLEGLAPGERIYSVRFMGDRAYMVTFKQVDPLFVIDLKDPKQPKALGELKIPGYSDYLQPYDENHLIGIGKETVEAALPSGPNGQQQTMAFYLGMKLAMFDVSDVTHPKELFKETIGDRGTDSEVLRNHKALLFDKEKNLLAFPVVVFETKGSQQKEVSLNTPPQYGEITFQGAYVYNIDLEQGFTLKGKITHVKETSQKYRIDQAAIQRILFVGENLYTVSPGKIKVNDLKTLDEKGALDLQ